MLKKVLLLKLIALALIAIIAIACTPKKTEADTTDYRTILNEVLSDFPDTSTAVHGDIKEGLLADYITREKLLNEMRTVDDGYSSSINFERYDEKSRIVRYQSQGMGGSNINTVFYNGDDLVKMVNAYQDGYSDDKTITETNFIRSGNIITIPQSEGNPRIITLNDEGYMIKLEWSNTDGDSLVRTFQYQNGNLVKMISQGSSEMEKVYEYGSGKTPFYQNNTPKWFLVYYFQNYGIYETRVGLGNNITTEIITDSFGTYETKYQYEFDSDGFPIVQYREGWRRTFTYHSE